ncbi:MAG: FtsX-like permease family protein [Myxococcota bacterium]
MLTSIRRSALALFVAFRLVRSRRSPRLSAVTLISILGVACGVMALTIVLAVTGGFQGAFQDRILGLYPHMVVLERAGDFRDYREILEDVRGTEGVVAASPATYDDMMMAAGVHRSGAVIKGVDPATVDDVIEVRPLLREGSLEDLEESPEVEVTGDTVEVSSVVSGKWLTVVTTGEGDPLVVVDDRTPPDQGSARVAVLDLRREGGALPLELRPVDEGADDPFEGLERRERFLPAARPGELSKAVEVQMGAWRLAQTGETLSLDPGTIVTVVLLPEGEAGALRTRLMVEPARVPAPERAGMVRLVDGRDSGGPLRLAGEEVGPVGPAIGPGEFTGYQQVRGRLPGIILGTALADKLDVEPGEEVTLVTPLRGVDNKMLGPYGMAPSSAHHRVTGVFESGFHEYDSRLALVNLEAAQRFLNRGDVVRWLEVRTEDVLRVDEVKRRVAALVDPYDWPTLVAQTNGFEGKITRYLRGEVRGSEQREAGTFVGGLRTSLQLVNLVKYQETDFGYRPRFRIIDWEEMNTNLFRALRLQKVVLTMFFLIIIVVGAFVVVGSQIMVIHEKTSEIAILKAMGTTKGAIRGIFTLQGLFVAGVGTALGLALGLGAVWVVDLVDYRLDASVYLIDRLPVQLEVLDLVLVVGATALCTLAATQYSAGRAVRKTVVEGLRTVD